MRVQDWKSVGRALPLKLWFLFVLYQSYLFTQPHPHLVLTSTCRSASTNVSKYGHRYKYGNKDMWVRAGQEPVVQHIL